MSFDRLYHSGAVFLAATPICDEWLLQVHQGLMHLHTSNYHFDVRTTVSLPEPLIENAKEYAAERGITN